MQEGGGTGCSVESLEATSFTVNGFGDSTLGLAMGGNLWGEWLCIFKGFLIN
jgi:hypothetical protein